jgi:prevent-host-death family protein
MITVNMLEAKTNLSKLVDQVETGQVDEIVLARNGRPVARIVPLTGLSKRVRLGLHDGCYPPVSLDEFNGLDAEVAGLFGVDEA